MYAVLKNYNANFDVFNGSSWAPTPTIPENLRFGFTMKNPIFCSVFHKNMDFHMVSYMILRVFHMVLHRICFPQNFPQAIKSVLSEFSTKISTKCDFDRKKHEFVRTSIRILFKFCRNLARSCRELRRIPIELVKIS